MDRLRACSIVTLEGLLNGSRTLDGRLSRIDRCHDATPEMLALAAAMPCEGPPNQSIMRAHKLGCGSIPEPGRHLDRFHDVGEHDGAMRWGRHVACGLSV